MACTRFSISIVFLSLLIAILKCIEHCSTLHCFSFHLRIPWSECWFSHQVVCKVLQNVHGNILHMNSTLNKHDSIILLVWNCHNLSYDVQICQQINEKLQKTMVLYSCVLWKLLNEEKNTHMRFSRNCLKSFVR